MTMSRRGSVARSRSLRSLALVTTLAITVAACGRGDDDDAADTGDTGDTEDTGDGAGTQPEASEGAAEGSIDVWAMGTEGEKLGALADGFMAEFPDITVNVTPVPFDAAHDRIVNSIAGGVVPDVSQIGTTWMAEFATLGGLEPTPASIDPAQFFEGSWDTTVVDGTSYGVPWYVETRLIYYRTDLAEQGGFNQAPADWAELTQLAQAQVDAGAKYGISLQPGGTGSWQTFMPFFWQAGGEMLDESGSFTLDSDACVEALTFYDSFFENGLTPPAVSDVPVEGQFANGEVGSFISGPWMIGIVTEAGADRATWTVAHQPTETTGTSFIGGSNLAVLDQSDNKPAAWAFIEYLSRPEVQVQWYETASALPSIRSAWDDPSLSDDPLLAAFGEQLEDAKSAPAISTWEQVASGIDDQVELVTIGDVAPADGCQAMQQEAESIGTGL
jgi:multiple sugar transport system substrate-binding protein